ncbi:MATE family efflux transporter [Clostridium vincentii]|uniref:Multidrug export protein MepA n=1 Tax=Clostridium vincentii TaxID=52704 RepID=A0A2T0B6R5_9CLOT|nr:MATE family efflux transporter [Clostridium vincentii]PRR79503.1 Multidrug export protein MepA [Clostridium vincentii]
MTKDMTTGSPLKLILSFSIPLLIGNIFQQFYSMVDAIIVGRFIGVKALAAVGSTGAMFFLVMGFTLGITSGFSIIVAQRFGADDKDGLRRSVATSIILCAIITILITAISLVTVKPLLNLMNTPSDIINDANSYITILYAGIITTVFYNMISSILRALGDSRTPLYFLIVASILNIILDVFFIVTLSMGVSGAAYATVISQGVSGLLCLIYTAKRYRILKLQKKDWKFDIPFSLLHLKVGIPMALQFSITAVGVIILQGALNAFGSTLIAAYTAAMKVEQLVMQPSISFGVTMATYAGQNLGAGKIHRIKEGVKKCSYLSLIVNVFAGIVVFLFGRNFTRLFISGAETEVIESAQRYLNIVAPFFIILGLLFIYRSTLQGIGEAFVPMMAGVAELVVRVVVAFTLPQLLGYTGICLASPIAWIAATIPLAIAYFMKINKLLSKQNENLSLSKAQ